jgi:hypothetical protein
LVTTVPDIVTDCNLFAEGTVSSSTPDPDPGNNTANTQPECAVTCPTVSPTFSLVDASNGDVLVSNLADGAEIEDPGVSYAVMVTGVDGIGSMVLNADGDEKTFNSGPYVHGNWSGIGSHSFDAYGWAMADAGAPICSESGIGFKIVEPPVVCDANIDSFSWVNTYTGDVFPLSWGSTIMLDQRDSFSVIANTSGSTVGSVVFETNFGVSRTDNDVEYSLTPESGGSYEPLALHPSSSTVESASAIDAAMTVMPGEYSVTAKVYLEADGNGELCAEQTTTFNLDEDSTPDYSEEPGCPASHPVTMLIFDHQPDPGDSPQDWTVALKYKGSSRGQSAVLTMELTQEVEIVLVATGSVGHPEAGCTQYNDGGMSKCDETSQTKESWEAVIDGSVVATYDDREPTDVYLSHPNHYMTLGAGSHNVQIRHRYASNNSVGAYLQVCTDGPSGWTAPQMETAPAHMP